MLLNCWDYFGTTRARNIRSRLKILRWASGIYEGNVGDNWSHIDFACKIQFHLGGIHDMVHVNLVLRSQFYVPSEGITPTNSWETVFLRRLHCREFSVVSRLFRNNAMNKILAENWLQKAVPFKEFFLLLLSTILFSNVWYLGGAFMPKISSFFSKLH